MTYQQLNFKSQVSGKFAEAVRQSGNLKTIKNRTAKRWQESMIIKTLLSALRGAK